MGVEIKKETDNRFIIRDLLLAGTAGAWIKDAFGAFEMALEISQWLLFQGEVEGSRIGE